MFLLDTNVVSEMMKQEPDRQVRRWFMQHRSNDMYISAITIGETVYGFHKMPDGKKKDRLSNWFEVEFLEWINDRIFPLGESVLRDWAVVKAGNRTLPVVDSLIAATAIAAGATIVTRNVKDFEGIEGLAVINPWEQSAS